LNAAGNLEMPNVVLSAITSAGNTLRATDRPLTTTSTTGVFEGDVTSGQINYVTGAITNLTFTSAIPGSQPITAKYIPYQPSLPTSMLFYKNTVILRPIPDDVYKVTIEAFRFPTALTQDGDEPEIRQWWQLLAYGASYKYFSVNRDADNLQYVKVLLDEQINLVERKTIKQLSNQRTPTIYNIRDRGRNAQRFFFPIGGP
jgi:hypothetical protein